MANQLCHTMWSLQFGCQEFLIIWVFIHCFLYIDFFAEYVRSLLVLQFSETTINWKINLVNQFTWYWVDWKDEKSFWSAATAFDVWREVQISFFALLEMDVNLLDFYTLQTESDFKKSIHESQSYHVKNLSQSNAHMSCNISIMVR